MRSGRCWSLTVRGLVNRMRFHRVPALSLVPEARPSPNSCCPTTAPVSLSLTVVVAGGVAQDVVGLCESGRVVGEHRTGQRVGADGVDDAQDLGPVGVVVDVNGDDRAEELLDHVIGGGPIGPT